MMRKPGIRALVGIVTFTLPVLVAVIGVRLDHSTLDRTPDMRRWFYPCCSVRSAWLLWCLLPRS